MMARNRFRYTKRNEFLAGYWSNRTKDTKVITDGIYLTIPCAWNLAYKRCEYSFRNPNRKRPARRLPRPALANWANPPAGVAGLIMVKFSVLYQPISRPGRGLNVIQKKFSGGIR